LKKREENQPDQGDSDSEQFEIGTGRGSRLRGGKRLRSEQAHHSGLGKRVAQASLACLKHS
jgi:hypothetical protein